MLNHYETLTGSDTEPLAWADTQQQTFKKIKYLITTALSLGIPNLKKPFDLYVAEKQSVASEVFIQRLGPETRPVAYFSKQLDSVVTGWPACLRAIAATALLVETATKLTLEQPL